MTTTLIAEQPAARRADGPAQDDVLLDLAERGLRRYAAQVAAAVGTGPEGVWCEWADAPSAYIALDHRIPDYPDRDAALTWAAEQGWAIAVETGCGEDLLMTACLAGDVLPPPRTVGTWVRAVLAGRRAPCSATVHAGAAVDADLVGRLANWTGHWETVDDRTG